MREIRSVNEIAERVRTPVKDDVFQFERQTQIVYLPWKYASEFLKPTVTEIAWNDVYTPITEAAVLDVMYDYLKFAWDKALNHRGLSASRSIQKIRAWLWLLGDEALEAYARDDANYAQYGVPILWRVSWDHGQGHVVPQDTRVGRMRLGLVCEPSGCVQGCIDLTDARGAH
jgi:hypothetical protein